MGKSPNVGEFKKIRAALRKASCQRKPTWNLIDTSKLPGKILENAMLFPQVLNLAVDQKIRSSLTENKITANNPWGSKPGYVFHLNWRNYVVH